jgi:O-antigen/teichoic acid export membrane protein
MPLGRIANLIRFSGANRGRIARAIGRTGKSGFWAMADQGVVSLGNFGINILLARQLAVRGSLAAYGNFAMLFELMWVLNSLHGALIVYPMTIKGAAADRPALARITSICLLLTVILGPVIGGAALLMASVISTASVGWWAALAAVVWQMQETTRRSLMAELKFKSALWGDGISYLGQIGGVWALGHFHRLSLEGIFQVMAATSALAAIVQILQIRVRTPLLTEIRSFARDAWNLGRWVLAGNASGMCTSTLFSINFRYWWGAEVVAVAFALNTLLRLTNPLMFGIVSLITPHAARARSEGGIPTAKRTFYKFAGLGALMLAPYLGVLIFFPVLSIRLALKDPAYQQFWWVLVLSAITQGLIYVGIVLGVFLNAVERSRAAFIGQIVYSGLSVVIGMPATALWGLLGAAWGGVFASAAQVILNLLNFARLSSKPTESAQVAHDPTAEARPVVAAT